MMNSVLATWMMAATMSAAGASGQWHNDYAAALKAAQDDNKPLLVVLHKPDQPEQAMQQVGYVSESGEDVLTDNYHLCQVDVNSDYGKQVAQLFKATSFPYVVITDKSAQQIIFRQAGTMTDGAWLTTLADYRRGVRPVAFGTTINGALYGGSAVADCPYCRQ